MNNSKTMNNSAVVLYTAPSIGHLVPMIELCNLVATLCPSLSVHLIIAASPIYSGDGAPSISFLSAASPLVTIHRLPVPSLPLDFPASSPNVEAVTLESLRLNNPDLRLSLESISGTCTVCALIVDLFCARAAPIARDLGFPFYMFYPCSAGTLALFLYLPIFDDSRTSDRGADQDDGGKLIHVPGLPPLSTLDLPKTCQNWNNSVNRFFLESSKEASSFAGIIVNTFEALEDRALGAIREGECRPGERIPIFCVGPVISSHNSGGQGRHECLTWLNGQPRGGVVFLCFGSMGVFPLEQLKEIATGLEMSGQRFLWVVRQPSDKGIPSLLPEGFLERTEGRGMVVSSWAPQLDVLRHESVGGFVTHCGWNSVLEAASAGVPMVAWPLYAEQRLNRLGMVEDIGIALRLEEDKGDGSVSAEEIGKKVRMLMEGEEGAAVRSKSRAMKDAAAAAVEKGGSSRVALEQLVESLKG